MNKKLKTSYLINVLFIFSLILYFLLLLKIIIFKNLDSPFDLITGNYVHHTNVNLDPYIWDIHMTDYLNKINILGNILLFIPLPLFYRSLNERNYFKFFKPIFLSFLLSLFFEGFQFFFEIGITDINDLILNTFGSLMGTIIYSLMKLIISKDNIKEFLAIFGSNIALILTTFLLIIRFFN